MRFFKILFTTVQRLKSKKILGGKFDCLPGKNCIDREIDGDGDSGDGDGGDVDGFHVDGGVGDGGVCAGMVGRGIVVVVGLVAVYLF